MRSFSLPTKIQALLLLFVLIFLSGCKQGHQAKKNLLEPYVVKKRILEKSLFFSGSIQPLSQASISTPMEGVIKEMKYFYGQRVKEGEVVFVLNSAELQRQYDEILTEYLKSKESYNVAQTKFAGTKTLWESGLMAKNNFLSEKSSLNHARIGLIQARKKLSELLAKTGSKEVANLTKLNLAEFDKVRLALSLEHNTLSLKAPISGLLLYPPSSSEDKAHALNLGSNVKSGQVLALVGDLTGLRVEIEIPELDITKIKPGMPALVSGLGFGSEVLTGVLKRINAQALGSSASALPVFKALAEVKELSPSVQDLVKVGMSANIELKVKTEDKLFVPVGAVKEEGSSSFVQVREDSGKIDKRLVITGSVQDNLVAIESGLKEGEVVLYAE